MTVTTDEAGEALERQSRQLETLDRLAQRFGQSLTGALTRSASSGRNLSDILDGVAGTLVSKLGSGAGSALSATLDTALQSAVRSLTATASLLSFGGDALPFAKGAVFAHGTMTPFARGGVVSQPTYFPMKGGLGLMGERGAEAVMPLARGPDGRLGVQAGAPAATQVTVNIAATDVDSFRRSQAQVAAELARAVARGRRAL